MYGCLPAAVNDRLEEMDWTDPYDKAMDMLTRGSDKEGSLIVVEVFKFELIEDTRNGHKGV